MIAIIALWASQANAQTCPPANGYVVANRPSLTEMPVDDIECGTPSCANGVVIPSPSVTRKEHLLVWLPGLNGSPSVNKHIANMAGYAGYRAIFLDWDNDLSVGAACADGTNLVGGPCATSDATDCPRIVRDELLSGRDDPSSDAYTPNPLDGIVPRLAMALNTQHIADPTGGWDDFCSPHPDHGTRIAWENIVVAGHSFGGNQAVYISYRNQVAGAFIVDSGYDVCDAELNSEADVLNASSPYNATGEPALWHTTFTDESPDSRIFVFHENELFPTITWDQLPPSLAYTANTADYDATTMLPEDGALYNIEDPSCTDPTCWAGEPFISTAQVETDQCVSVFPGHASVATDICMPPDVTGGDSVSPDSNPITEDSSQLHVFHTYVEALCSF
jgi:hypothetical protein